MRAVRLLSCASFLAALAAAAPAAAQQPGVPAPEAAAAAPQAGPADDPRVNQLIIYGDDPCPQSSNDEIIVCYRLGEDERFRIPPALRQNPNAPEVQSWANRAVELSYAGRTGIGSCSPAGAGGMVGCFNQIVQQARAERGATVGFDWNAAIEEARQERMRRINAAEQEEAEEESRPD